MKYYTTAFVTAVTAVLLPQISLAASIVTDGTGGDLGTFVKTTLTFISGTVIPFILGIAFLFFVWGIFMYFIQGGHNEEAQETGKTYIFSSLIGFVIILSFWGVISLVTNGIGLNETDPATLPTTTIAPAP